ncbi:MAG TPA: hypothetical protein ENN21_10105 [Spirochaetes bacterium]|nr:hypothetical protein [Spirochaetota bacterium]
MAISKSEKTIYNEHVKDLKAQIDASQKKLSELDKRKRENPRITEYYTIESILELLKIILLNVNISDASLEILKFKNEKALKDARTGFFEVLKRLEQLLGDEIDRPLRENEERLQKIEKINPQQWLKLVQRIHYILSTLIDRIGETSKWKWSFVDLLGRVAVVSKNAVNFSDVQKYRDPRTEFYYDRQELLKLAKQSLRDAAQQYRNKYEQSTKVPGDMLKSIGFLSTLRRIHILFSETEEANKLKITIDALRARIESDEKEQEKEKKTVKK